MTDKQIPRSKAWLGLLIGILLLAVIRIPFQAVSPAVRGTSDLADLPHDLLYSWLRMLSAYLASLVCAIFVGSLAATSERRAKILLPLVDVLQSVPIFGFFPAAIYWFVRVGGQHVGVEAAVIFLIFTCQSWNLIFAVYDGIKSVPTESMEASQSMGLGDLAVFRRIYIPASFPRIIDNSVISWANGWYFLMACEIIALGPLSYKVPGIGSFLQHAIEDSKWSHVGAGLAGLVLVIVLMDVFLWKPLRSLSAQYKFESNKQEATSFSTGDRLLALYRNSWLFAPLRKVLDVLYLVWVKIEQALQPPSQEGIQTTIGWKWGSSSSMVLFWGLLLGLGVVSFVTLGKAVVPPYAIAPSKLIFSIFVSMARIAGAYTISLVWILPLVYWAHRRPLVMRVLQSSAQVLASVPATAFFPLIILAITRTLGSVEFAVMLLLMTGMQWYLLFNVLGGANSLPNDIREVSQSLGVGRWLYIKRIFLPAIVPALVTGSITAVGGGWNALVISEYFKSTSISYKVFGIGSIINIATYENGDEKLLCLSLLLMVAFIVVLNRYLWQPLYHKAEKKFRLEG